MIIQPIDIIKALKVKNEEEALKIFSLAYAWLSYIPPGSCIETTYLDMHKIDEDTVFIDKKFNIDTLAKTLEETGNIKLPI